MSNNLEWVDCDFNERLLINCLNLYFPSKFSPLFESVKSLSLKSPKMSWGGHEVFRYDLDKAELFFHFTDYQCEFNFNRLEILKEVVTSIIIETNTEGLCMGFNEDMPGELIVTRQKSKKFDDTFSKNYFDLKTFQALEETKLRKNLGG